jgi:hypothetical protein
MIVDRRPVGLTLLSLFFAFGGAMAALTCLALLTQGGPLELLWRVNPEARFRLGDCVRGALGSWLSSCWRARALRAGSGVAPAGGGAWP